MLLLSSLIVLTLEFALGLIFGSFISALTWRYPRKISIKKGRSICPNCKKQISWYDNIPVLSFILLGGRCRNCKKRISLRYPAIELTSAIGFLCLSLAAPSDYFRLIFMLSVFIILFSIFVMDLEGRIIPDQFVFFGIAVAVVYYFFTESSSLVPYFFAGIVSGAILILIHLITKGRGMGLGDVKFAVLGGLLVGPQLFLIWLFLAFLTGAVAGIILIIAKKARLKSELAFGPFLVIAVPLALVYGEKILTWVHLN